jgi:hypothetical protein
MTTNSTITPELLDQLLANYEKPENLTSDEGLFKQLKNALIERALGAELTEHLGYEKGDPAIACGHAGLDGHHGYGFRLWARVPSNRHESSDHSGRWDALEAFGIGPFGPSSARRPFADDAQRSSEAACRQTAPEFSAVVAIGGPLLVEPWQVHIRRF